MAIELILRSAPTIRGDHYFGSAEKTLVHDSKLKLQLTGPDAEVLLFEGPPEGKKWAVVINVFVKETEA